MGVGSASGWWRKSWEGRSANLRCEEGEREGEREREGGREGLQHTCAQVHEPRVPKDLLEMEPESNLEFTSVHFGSQPSVFVGSNNGINSTCDVT